MYIDMQYEIVRLAPFTTNGADSNIKTQLVCMLYKSIS
jgi:hypothetical protein